MDNLPQPRLLEKLLSSKNEHYWNALGEKNALSLFRDTAKRVPAYQDFLRTHRIRPESIRTSADFARIPPITKENYLKKHILRDLCPGGTVVDQDMISVSSGSTGEPFFWPRADRQDRETMLTHEMFLRNSFKIHEHSTLFIVAFSMGMWVAGTLTYRCMQDIAQHYPLTVVTPGIQKDVILNIIRKIGGNYDQIILAGYPPFIKDVIDEGEHQGISWKKMKLKFLFAAESFSESWRDYLYKKVNATDVFHDSLNIYGTADALVLGHETPLSILVRRMAFQNRSLYESIFSEPERTPTLVQYNPAFRYFEQQNNSLLFSARSGIPLLRYSIGDSGAVISFSRMASIFTRHGISLLQKAREFGIDVWRLPFLYVLGRSDFTASLYGVNIYPEHIRAGLEHRDVASYMTGKFTMFTRYDRKMNPHFEINVELKNKIKMPDKKSLAHIIRTITRTLKQYNNEYRTLAQMIGHAADPEVIVRPYNYSEFFSTGIKQKWHIGTSMPRQKK